MQNIAQELAHFRIWLHHEKDTSKRAEIYLHIARLLRSIGLFEDAKSMLDSGLSDCPENPLLLRAMGLELFRDGRIAEGLSIYDKGRWQLESFDKYRRPFQAPFWRGEKLAGKKLLVWAEQGIGDQVMQSRVLHKLLQMGAEVTLEADQRLHDLLKIRKHIRCYQQFVKPHQSLMAEDFDFQTSMLSAWRFVPSPLSHSNAIEADPKLTARYKEIWNQIGEAKNVGLSWHSKAEATGLDRSMDPALLRPFSNYKNTRFHSLQYGDVDLSAVGKAIGVTIFNDRECDPLKELNGQAAQISALDLVITIDNATAHIASALGTPCWVLLPKASEWRWGTVQKPVQLYPSVRTFRADAVGDWSAALWQLFKTFDDWSNATLGG